MSSYSATNYNSTVEDISMIIGNYDPNEVIISGCPLDEYMSEAEMIYNFIKNNPKYTEEQLSDSIQMIFMRLDKLFMDYEDCMNISNDIKKILQ